MAQNYQVNYDINVFAEDAVQAIGRFTMAAEQLKKASAPFQKLNQKINSLKSNITSLGKVKAEVFINTKKAEASIDRLQAKLDTLIATARSLNLSVGAGGGVGSALSRGRAAARSSVGGTSRQASRSSATYTDPVAARWQHQSQRYAEKARFIKDNASMFGRNYKTDPLYSQYMAMSNKAGQRAFARQYPGITGAWNKAYENYVPPFIPMRGRGRASSIGARRSARVSGRSVFPNNLGYKTLGATPLDVGGMGAVDMLKGMGVAYGIMGVGTAIGSAISDATEYDNIIQTTKNILGSHDKDANFEGRFRGMEQNIRNIGVKTKFTAPEVADASKFLAMAGFNIDEINSAMRPIADIALIADTDIGETADVVTNIMTAYGMGASQLRDIADKMTMTFTMSNTTLPEMAESYKYFASIARANNWSFDETTGMIGILGDAGLKGSHAGTTIRQLMNNLIKPSKTQKAALERFGVRTKNDDGTLRSPYQIFKELAAAGATSSTFDLFRVTAAQGGVSLMQSVEKWDKIIEENRNASGISSRLAEAKQNTVQGLWAQATSMFTEGSMQAFEAVRPEVSNMLKGLTDWLGSDEARNKIKAFAQDIVSFAKVLGDITKQFIGFYETFRKPLLLLLELQLRLWPLTWAMRVFKSHILGVAAVAKSFLIFSRISTVISLFTTNLRRGTSAIKDFGTAQMFALGRNGANPIGSLGYSNATLMRGRYIDPDVWNRYTQIYGGRAGKSVMGGIFRGGMAGLGAIGGAIGGYYAGNAINEGWGGIIGTTIGGAVGGVASSFLATPAAWSAISSMLPALFTNPFGWAALVGAAALSIGTAFAVANKEIHQGHVDAQAWIEDFKQLSIAGIDVGKQFGLIQAYQRIEASGMSDAQKNILRQQAFERWNDSGIPTSEIPDDSTPYSNTPLGANLKRDLEIADQIWGKWAYFGDILKSMPEFHQSPRWYEGKEYSDAFFNGHRLWELNDAGGMTGMNETQATQAALLLAGMDANSPIAQKIQELAMSQIYGVSRYSDVQSVWDRLYKEYMPKNSYYYNDKSSEDILSMGYTGVSESTYYQWGLQWRLQQLKNEYDDWTTLIRNYDNDVAITAEQIQGVLFARLGTILDPQFGIFGTEGFNQKIQEIYNNPTQYGYSTQKSAISAVQKTFTDLLDFFNLLDVHYKPLFAGYLNRNIWENMLPQGYQLPAGGYTGGTKPGDKSTFDGVEYEWKELSAPYAKGSYGWVNKMGRIYTPSNASQVNQQKTQTPTNNPTNNTKKTPTAGGPTGANQSNYKSHYNNNTAVPKQVIVKIENLMNVKSIDLTNSDNVAVVNNVKQQLTQALIDVVHDFDETYHG